MKKPTYSRNIMTETTPDDEIIARYNEEYPRAFAWVQKHAASQMYEDIDGLDKECLEQMKLEDGELSGIVPWVSPKNGDMFVSVCYTKRTQVNSDYIKRHVACPTSYLWNTAASIGFIKQIRLDLESEPEPLRMLLMFTSHCIYRVKERLKLPYDGIALLIFVIHMTDKSGIYAEKNGKTLYFINEYGVFRVPLDRDKKVLRAKTFLAKEMLTGKEKKMYKDNWKEITTPSDGKNTFTTKI